MEERLQKVMAHAGVASRRASEQLIREGRVTVNGQVVREMGTKVDPDRDVIVVDGELLQVGASRMYIKLNKPVGIISTASDRWQRRTVLDLVQVPGRVYPVGRLDADSEGLMLLTNDGEVTARLTHPRFGHEKTYIVLVKGHPRDEVLDSLVKGVELSDGVAHAVAARVIPDVPKSAPRMELRSPPGMTWLEITMAEGQKREIRRMMEKVGYPVERLIRVRLGPIELGDLQPGESRRLTAVELRALFDAIRRPPASRRGRPRGKAGRSVRERGARPKRGRGRPPRQETRNKPRRRKSS